MARGREALPLTLAFAASLTLHAAFALLLPGTFRESRRGERDAVIVDLKGLPEPPRVSAEGPAPQPAPPGRAGAPSPRETRAPDPGGETAEAAEPATAPPAPRESPTPTATTPPPAPEASPEPGERAAPAVRALPSLTAAPPAKKPPPSLRELMPARRDLSGFRSRAPLPDPASGEAVEATLGLDETDERYLGYRQQVEAAIYGAWRVGRALVVAGGNRSVLVRLTLDDAGLVREARVLESAGNPTLDAEAVEAVRRARIPPFPRDWTIQRLTLMAQFDYLFR